MATLTGHSPALQWEVLKVRSNSAFLVRQNGRSDGGGRQRFEFSREAGNLSGNNSFSASGLVNPKTVDISADAEGKGAVVTVQRTGRAQARKTAVPQKVSFRLTKDHRRGNKAVRGVCSGYRDDLTQAALARYSKIKVAQKSKGVNKKRTYNGPRGGN